MSLTLTTTLTTTPAGGRARIRRPPGAASSDQVCSVGREQVFKPA
jgi:hypothetical protein